jgi:SAM-dependent methyltransferase
LDVCGGTGFPVLELKKQGWDVTYADGSPEMLTHFSQVVVQAGLDIPCYLSDWEALSKNISQKFDLVMCRGNSLLYIDSWGNYDISEDTGAHIKLALQEFYKMLKEGGILYIDMYSKENGQIDNATICVTYDDRVIDGQKIGFAHEISLDDETRIRIWKPVVIIEDQSYEFILQSYYLKHEELVSLLAEIGFRNIEETSIAGESFYTVYTAFK